jgi:cobalt/nickel transport system ATP-binding protein
MAEPLYTLTDVSYSYPGNFPALCHLDLVIQKGERIALIGANGTGKSTLLTLLDALIFPTEGSVQTLGKTITGRTMNDVVFQRLFRCKTGFVFQNPDIQLFCPTVRDDILFGPLQLGVEKSLILQRFESVTQRLHLAKLLDRSPHQLSLGEKKKVAIASVLIIEPDTLLLDEPTAGLDPQTTRDIIDVLSEEHAAGKTVITATHDLHMVEEIADLVHVFGPDKTIIRSGPSGEILADHAFLQANNLMHTHKKSMIHPVP